MKAGRGFTQNESETGLVVCGQSYTCEYGLCKDVNLLGDYLERCSDMTNKSLRGYVVTGGKLSDSICGVHDRGCGVSDRGCRVVDGCVFLGCV